MMSWAYRTLTLVALTGVCLPLMAGCAWTGESGCFSSETPPPALSIRLEESLVLGAQISSPREYLFGNVRFVQTDQVDHIYVADTASMEVKIYGPEGRHLRTIGGRGRGPGKFRGINCMWVSDDGAVIVIDGLNKRITFMNSRGEVLKTKPVDTRTMLWPRRMQAIGRQFALLYKLPESRDDSDGLFHLFDLEFEGEIDRFGSYWDFGAGQEELELSYIQVNPGYFWVESPQAILYSPSLYRGKLYRLGRIGNQWETTQILCGYVEGDQPLSEV
ncbi:MAG: 6-bladed beta-propeller, partial [Acidobacteriota bacterium]